ncbi:MAG TPA: cytochrome c biogenesis protein CcsA, partial [Burkholderiaceae bacterium]|nr:cytochrome c biogenesis protein CcsA [Burkholderiaceae bacterium]
VSYGLFAVAVLHAWLLDGAERRLRSAPHPASGRPLAGSLPLLQLERLTFRFVEVGFVVLSAALLLGALLLPQWRLDHKTVLSLLGWATFAVLIGGRHLRGWRGRQATRWVYAGALLLLLAYAGARFVLEVVLKRGGA